MALVYAEYCRMIQVSNFFRLVHDDWGVSTVPSHEVFGSNIGHDLGISNFGIPNHSASFKKKNLHLFPWFSYGFPMVFPWLPWVNFRFLGRQKPRPTCGTTGMSRLLGSSTLRDFHALWTAMAFFSWDNICGFEWFEFPMYVLMYIIIHNN